MDLCIWGAGTTEEILSLCSDQGHFTATAFNFQCRFKMYLCPLGWFPLAKTLPVLPWDAQLPLYSPFALPG